MCRLTQHLVPGLVPYPVNVVLLRGDGNSWLLVDAGVPSGAPALLAALRETMPEGHRLASILRECAGVCVKGRGGGGGAGGGVRR